MDCKEVLDTFFREMDEKLKPKQTVDATQILGSTMLPEAPLADHHCPFHEDVSLQKKTPAKGCETVHCSEKNCPIGWGLPWDQNLSYVLSELKQKMPASDQQEYFCDCRKVCQVGLEKDANSTLRGRCYLYCAQSECKFIQWIDDL